MHFCCCFVGVCVCVCVSTWYVFFSFFFFFLQIQRGHSCTKPGLLSDYCDGDSFKTHSLFSLHSDALQVHFYYDEVEVCNPIGSHKKIHKLGK